MNISIEVGKSYLVSSKARKSVTEVEIFTHPESGKKISSSNVYRSGSFKVTINNQEEQELLQSAVNVDTQSPEYNIFEGHNLDLQSFESFELVETSDNTYQSTYHEENPNGEQWTEEEIEEFEDDYGSDLWEYISDYEFIQGDSLYYIVHGVTAEEITT